MKFVSRGIGARVHSELGSATAAMIVVAYFLPDHATETVLRGVPDLTIIYLGEYTITNPYRLEALTPAVRVRCLEPDSPLGKLHAKVVLVQRRDGSRWALVGSANFTRAGLFDNCEAGVELDSNDASDHVALAELQEWVGQVNRVAQPPDWVQAKLWYDALPRYKLERSPSGGHGTAQGGSAWAIKTTSSDTGVDHWKQFLEEEVVAIGWPDVSVNPGQVGDAELRDAIRVAYPREPETNVRRIGSKLRSFFRLRAGDRVLITKGYAPNQRSGVLIYGVARIESAPRDDAGSTWWRFKAPALIQPVGSPVPKWMLATALGKGSLREAIHSLAPGTFDRLTHDLRSVSGLLVQV